MATVNNKTYGGRRALFILASLILVGCQGIEISYFGYKANDESIIQLLTSGTRQGVWNKDDIALNYQYDYTDSALNISGALALGTYYDINFNLIRSLDVYLFFLDTNSRVLKTALLVQSLGHRPDQPLAFAKKLSVPAGSRSFTLGYLGEATEVGSMKGTNSLEFFYNLPQQPH